MIIKSIMVMISYLQLYENDIEFTTKIVFEFSNTRIRKIISTKVVITSKRRE